MKIGKHIGKRAKLNNNLGIRQTHPELRPVPLPTFEKF